MTIDAIVVMPGYFDSRSYKNYNRIKALRIVTENKKFTLKFKDQMKPQKAKFPAPISFTDIKFYIKEVYSGSNDNTAISEIKFFYKDKEIKRDLFNVDKYLTQITEEEAGRGE